MKIGIVTDSTSDLPKETAAQHGIEVIPTIIVLEGVPYADGESLPRDEFYKRLPAMRIAPTTAAPSSGSFEGRYRKLIEAGCDHVISIHAPSALTAICNAARLAAESFPKRVTVIDSGSLSFGLGFQAIAAAEAAAQGGNLASVLRIVQSVRERLRLYAMLDTMEYLKRSGRVPALITSIGGLLNLKPLIELKEGKVISLGAGRTTGQRIHRLKELLHEMGRIERLAVLHTGAEGEARQFMDEVNAPADTPIVIVTTVIGAHVGPNGLGFAAVKK
jgi:DegV family protein with EDD domain